MAQFGALVAAVVRSSGRFGDAPEYVSYESGTRGQAVGLTTKVLWPG
jgi:hypothetical protein